MRRRKRMIGPRNLSTSEAGNWVHPKVAEGSGLVFREYQVLFVFLFLSLSAQHELVIESELLALSPQNYDGTIRNSSFRCRTTRRSHNFNLSLISFSGMYTPPKESSSPERLPPFYTNVHHYQPLFPPLSSFLFPIPLSFCLPLPPPSPSPD